MFMQRHLSAVGKMTILTTALAAIPMSQATTHFDAALAAFQAGRHQEAISAMRSSARAEDARAQYFLSTLYRTGKQVGQDEDMAFQWCERAAENGLIEAQFQLGVMYLRGEGVEEDNAKALDWLWQAADRGYPQAKEVLEYVLHNMAFTYGC